MLGSRANSRLILFIDLLCEWANSGVHIGEEYSSPHPSSCWNAKFSLSFSSSCFLFLHFLYRLSLVCSFMYHLRHHLEAFLPLKHSDPGSRVKITDRAHAITGSHGPARRSCPGCAQWNRLISVPRIARPGACMHGASRLAPWAPHAPSEPRLRFLRHPWQSGRHPVWAPARQW